MSDFKLIQVHNEITQKCWLSPSTLSHLHGSIGTYLKISTIHRDILCQAWPSNEIQENCIHFTYVVCSEKSNKCAKITSINTAPCKHVNVTIIVNDYKKVKCLRTDLHNHPNKLENMCQNLLRTFCIATDYVIYFDMNSLATLYGIVGIVINSCDEDSYSGFIVDHDTKFCLKNIISKERYVQKSSHKLCQIGGLDKESKELADILKIPFHCQSFIPGDWQKCFPKGILLRGPAGTGKTSLVKSVTNECNAFLITVNGPEVFGARPGETEENLKAVLDKAVISSEEGHTILFFDEIDTLCPNKSHTDGDKEVNTARLVIDFFDEIKKNNNIMVIGATNRPASVDLGLRRPGRFDKEVMINVPNSTQRADILRKVTISLPLSSDVDLERLVFLTNGYVGADLVSVCREAALMVLLDKNQHGEKCSKIEMQHFELAVHKVMPSIKKGTVGLVDLSPVYWSQIGGLADVKAQIQQAVEWPINHPEAFTRMGLPYPKGVLLYGPPGCCKTTLVRAAATSTNATFISLNGAQLYSPYVGDSEQLIAEVFQKARAAAPSIIFLDELDSIVGKRSHGSSNRGVQERILSSLLNEMDGIGIKLDEKIHTSDKVLEGEPILNDKKIAKSCKMENRNVLLVAATNRPDLVDDALLRPGRIDRILYVPPPDEEARLEILRVYTNKMPIRDVDLNQITAETDMFSGADLQNLCREAALHALTDNLSADHVTMHHFSKALSSIEPSLSPEVIEKYSRMTNKT